MRTSAKLGIYLAATIMAAGVGTGAASAAEPDRDHAEAARPAAHASAHAPAHPPEAHAGPKGYDRVTEPKGWNTRPTTVDRTAYQHNYKAARSYKIGPYHRPPGWTSHHWGYGDILPRAYWTSSYLLADYWLFSLEVPPAGYEWVRDGDDALLVNTDTGEILQVESGVFS
jgi:Ni/Co efflux regulator RcnB